MTVIRLLHAGYMTVTACYMTITRPLPQGGSLSPSESSSGGNALLPLRSIRVLRPLRTVRRIRGMRVVVQSLLHSLPQAFPRDGAGWGTQSRSWKL